MIYLYFCRIHFLSTVHSTPTSFICIDEDFISRTIGWIPRMTPSRPPAQILGICTKILDFPIQISELQILILEALLQIQTLAFLFQIRGLLIQTWLGLTDTLGCPCYALGFLLRMPGNAQYRGYLRVLTCYPLQDTIEVT